MRSQGLVRIFVEKIHKMPVMLERGRFNLKNFSELNRSEKPKGQTLKNSNSAEKTKGPFVGLIQLW